MPICTLPGRLASNPASLAVAELGRSIVMHSEASQIAESRWPVRAERVACAQIIRSQVSPNHPEQASGPDDGNNYPLGT